MGRDGRHRVETLEPSALLLTARHQKRSIGDHVRAAHEPVGRQPRGSLWVGERDGRFYVVCANPISHDGAERIRQKLEPLREMTNDDIKSLYKQKLRAENEASSKGAGLGFLTVARDASEPIEFDFVDETGPCGPFTTFYLKATI